MSSHQATPWDGGIVTPIVKGSPAEQHAAALYVAGRFADDRDACRDLLEMLGLTVALTEAGAA